MGEPREEHRLRARISGVRIICTSRSQRPSSLENAVIIAFNHFRKWPNHCTVFGAHFRSFYTTIRYNFIFDRKKMELQQIESERAREREEWKKIAQTNKPNEKLVAHDAEYGIVLIITIIIIILKGSFSLFSIYLSCIVLSHEKNGFGSAIFLRCRFYWLHRIKNEQQ